MSIPFPLDKDQLISHYLPVVRGHIVKNYEWMARRGNCLISVDDLIQVASIALLKLVGRWDEIVAGLDRPPTSRDHAGRLFWSYLKDDVKWTVMSYYKRDGEGDVDINDRASSLDREHDDDGGTIDPDIDVHTSLRLQDSSMSWQVVHDQIIEYYQIMPQRDKVHIALRYFDELPIRRVADILEAKEGATAQFTMRAVTRWRTQAQNLFLEFPNEIEPRRHHVSWDPPGTLLGFTEARHRKDLPEYLWYATECFRADVSYLVDILGFGMVRAPGVRRTELSPYFQAQADIMIRDGVSLQEIANRLGVTKDRVWKYSRQRRASE